MAKVTLCDRCGAIIKDFVIKQVSFELNSSRKTVYDVCDKCYDELEECMKLKEEKSNG